ncbi:tail fiber domain-containing protein [Escherichia coli]|uniref:tail fiber domain-containing protein n=1 Tax=Escherichia coli TaxID=562 RepID=UPI001BFD461C|nr:tail fiber domain-containing protein [Escherichia coli]
MIYTIGNIAVSGNTLTGTGTNFKAPLSMIRVGCTVIVKSDPIQIFSITEIVSETELSVTPAASPDIPAGTAYSILLCDSISVDGLAQDVAEALRYFTGQESEIYAAVEYWKNYGDAAQVEALLTAIQAETAQSTANAAATAADVETTAAALNEAVAAKDAAEAAAANAEQQAATATTQATTATEQATAAAEAAEEAKQHRATAYTWMSNAEAAATTATEQATTATEKATAATDAATAAQEALTLTQEARDTATQQATIATEQATIATDAANAAETSAANVAADEQEIAANAAAAAEAATAAALSEANAKTYAEQAKALSEDSLSLIGLGADRRDWPDCTTDPSAYIGFVRLEEATATGFPSIASGEVYLVGWLARGDGLIINGCFVGTKTRSLYTYMYNNADGTYGWTRHARKDEVSRLTQANNSTGETQLWDGLGQNYIFVNNTGWGAYSVNGAIKLGINYGGTGGGNAGQARHNLAVMHEMKTTLSEIDLNTLTGEYSGIYWQTSSAGATDERHYPTHVAGALVVLKNGANSASGCTQIYYPYNNSDVYYVRWCSGSDLAWSAWVAYASHRETINGIGLGASPRHCSDLTGNPSAYIGFLRLTPAGTTGYPDVASDEGALSGYICRNDGEPSYSGLFVGATTGSAYTYRYSVGGGVQWQRIPRANDLSASADLTVNSLTTTTAVRSGGGDLHILGDTAYREAMNCGLTGYDSTGQNMGWYLGTYKSQEYKVYFEDYLGSEGIELNGDNGSVKLYTGGPATGTPAELTLYDNQCLSTVNYTIKPASSSWDRYFTMENSGTAYHNGTYQFWGNAVYDGSSITGDRYSVFEWKLDTGYLAYLERSADGSQKLQVNGGIHCTAVTQSSDRDLKDNIEVIPDATAAIRKMNGYTYTLKENGLPYAGIIAQEAMEAIPEAVGSFMWEGEELEGPTQDGRELRETARYLNVDYAAVTGLLVQVARETDDRVTALEEENASLRANIAVMDERITKLEALVQQLTGSEE